MWKDRGKLIIFRIKNLIRDYDYYSREDFSKELEKLVRQKLLHIGFSSNIPVKF
jgi:hypothetical protein